MVLLAIPPILVNAYAGIHEVDRDLVEAARGMGFRERQILRRVELPVALPVVLGGIRSASVQIVATATLGAIFGFGGLGRFLVDGIAQNDDGQTWGGVVLVASLVLLSESAFALAQRRLTSRGLRAVARPGAAAGADRGDGVDPIQPPRRTERRGPQVPCPHALARALDASAGDGYSRPTFQPISPNGKGVEGDDPMRLSRTLALGASMLVLFGACSTGGGSSTPTAAAPTATPAAASSTPASTPTAAPADHQDRLGRLLRSQDHGRDLRPGPGGPRVHRRSGRHRPRDPPDATNPALESGQIDLEPEYIGSELASFEPGKQTGDPTANMTELQNVLNTKGGGITVLTFSPAADQNAFVVRKDTATSLNLAKMSDTTAVQDQLKWGLATDCKTNPVCAAALKTAYGLDPKSVTYLSACDTPMAQALLAKTIDVGELCSTQPDIAQNGWVVLQDDKATQPADNIAPLVRNDYLAKLGDKAGFEAILNAVSAKMDTATLTKLERRLHRPEAGHRHDRQGVALPGGPVPDGVHPSDSRGGRPRWGGRLFDSVVSLSRSEEPMDRSPLSEYLELADWRRQVAAAWDAWRRECATDPAAATAAYRAGKDVLFRGAPAIAPAAGAARWLRRPALLAVRPGVADDGPPEPFDTPTVGPHDESPAAAAAAASIGGPLGLALPNSGSANPTFRRIGRVSLSGPLAGQQLAVFWLEGYGGGLFVPFRDATSGVETYGAGAPPAIIKGADHGGNASTGELVLDFNMAYHPSCAYDPRWSCPLAPPENRLAVAVPVGEHLA